MTIRRNGVDTAEGYGAFTIAQASISLLPVARQH